MENNPTKMMDRPGKGSGLDDVPNTVKAELNVLTGKDRGKTFSIHKAETVIGRGELADIKIADENISRSHALISFRNLEFRVKDLKSANGILLNGSEVTEYAMRDKDRLVVGETMMQFRVTLK